MNKRTPKERFDAAMDRVEQAAMELIQRAEALDKNASPSDTVRWQRIYLLQEARAYASAIRHLARVK